MGIGADGILHTNDFFYLISFQNNFVVLIQVKREFISVTDFI